MGFVPLKKGTQEKTETNKKYYFPFFCSSFSVLFHSIFIVYLRFYFSQTHHRHQHEHHQTNETQMEKNWKNIFIKNRIVIVFFVIRLSPSSIHFDFHTENCLVFSFILSCALLLLHILSLFCIQTFCIECENFLIFRKMFYQLFTPCYCMCDCVDVQINAISSI